MGCAASSVEVRQESEAAEPEPEPEPAPDRGELEQELSKLSKRQLRQRAEASVRRLASLWPQLLSVGVMTQIGSVLCAGR